MFFCVVGVCGCGVLCCRVFGFGKRGRLCASVSVWSRERLDDTVFFFSHSRAGNGGGPGELAPSPSG